jgi:hypothetical protein
MAVSKSEIRRWIESGIKNGATHVIVVCDTFDHEDYPVYVMQNESVKDRVSYYQRASMQTIMEIYNLSMDVESQLNEYRAWHV